MKHRNILAVIFYSIITLGIYDLFWLANTKKVLNEKTKVHTPTLWLLFAPLLAFGAVVVLQVINGHNGHTIVIINILSVLVGVVAVIGLIVIPILWLLKFCKAVNEYTSGQMSTGLSFVLLYLLRFVGIAVIQDHFNDMSDGTSFGSPAASGPAYAEAPAPQPAQPPADSTPTPPVATPTPVESPEPPVSPTPPTSPTVG